ncbi:MAG: hypothetical protein WBM59_00655, partial [Sedimenticolaceae bacterium]
NRSRGLRIYRKSFDAGKGDSDRRVLAELRIVNAVSSPDVSRDVGAKRSDTAIMVPGDDRSVSFAAVPGHPRLNRSHTD